MRLSSGIFKSLKCVRGQESERESGVGVGRDLGLVNIDVCVNEQISEINVNICMVDSYSILL